MEIARGVHLVPGTASGNVCLVTEPDIVLFDTGLPGDGPAILKHLAHLGVAPGELRSICLTHGHAGHAGSAAWLRRQSAARILASAPEADRAADPRACGALRTLWHLLLRTTRRPVEACMVDRILQAGDEMAGFIAVETPGHTDGHLAYFRASDGVLIAGDAVRVAGRDLLAPPFWDTASEVTARISLAKLADLPIRLLIPGHGPPYRAPGAALRQAGGPPGFMLETMRRRAQHQARRRR